MVEEQTESDISWIERVLNLEMAVIVILFLILFGQILLQRQYLGMEECARKYGINFCSSILLVIS